MIYNITIILNIISSDNKNWNANSHKVHVNNLPVYIRLDNCRRCLSGPCCKTNKKTSRLFQVYYICNAIAPKVNSFITFPSNICDKSMVIARIFFHLSTRVQGRCHLSDMKHNGSLCKKDQLLPMFRYYDLGPSRCLEEHTYAFQ